MADPYDSQSSVEEESESEDETLSQPEHDHLEYPQIYLETSFDSLLRNSHASHSSSSTVTMARANHQAESHRSGLSESWASISDAELSQNDDLLSEHTDAESLVDVRHDDDILSSHEVEVSDEEEEDAVSQKAPQDQDAEVNSPAAPFSQQSLSESAIVPTYITLDESNIPSQSENVLVRHTMKVFSQQEAEEMFSFTTEPELVGTIDLTLNKCSLKDSGRRSLRLLLVGEDYLPSLRDSIVNKVADALVASGTSFNDSQISSPSRYHIVPDSFGPGSVPSTAEVIPIDCQLEVDRFDKIHHSNAGVTLTETASGKTLVCERLWSSLTHDLAIIVTTDQRSETMQHTLSAFLRQLKSKSMPCIVVTVGGSWYFPHPAPVSGIHRSISARPVWDGQVYRRLPIDLDTFLNLNAAQLSRHLSWLVNDAERARLQSEYEHGFYKYDLVLNELYAVGVRIRETLARVSPFFVIVLLFSLALQSLWTLWREQPLVPDVANQTAHVTTTLPPVIVDATPSTSTTTTAIASPTVSVTNTVPLSIDATKSTSGKFEVEVIGSSHLVVRTPQKAKGKAPLKVVLSRQGQLIPADIKLLFPCVYSVHVPGEQLYGEITVRLEMPTPRLVDTIKLDLGPQAIDAWLKEIIEEAEHNLQSNLAQFQEALQGLGHSETRQKFTEQAKLLVANISERLGFEQRVQEPLRRLDNQRVAFNQRLDVIGADLYGQFTNWLAQRQPIHQNLPKKAGKLLKHKISFPRFPRVRLPSLEAVRLDFDARRRWRDASQVLREHQTQKLATAQDRAQQLVGGWRRKKDRRRGER